MALTKVQNTGIADDAVTTDKIENSTVVAADIAPGTIANAKLANSSITLNGSAISLGGSSTLKHIDWQAVTVADGSTTLTAEAGKGYFLDTNTGVIEVFLPTSPTRGDTIVLSDYGGTFGTNQIIINTGGNLIDSTTGPDFKVTTDNSVVELVYVDANKGWLVKLNQAAGTTPSSVMNAQGGYDTPDPHISATGGTVTTSGDFKIHTFTGDGCFVVDRGGLGTQTAPSIVDYMVVAGGGGGGGNDGGGGGAGGFRESLASASPTHTANTHTASPLKATTGITVTAQTYPISVGAGGTGGTATVNGGTGGNSVFSTITSAGGAGGKSESGTPNVGLNGGSGSGGGAGGGCAGTGGSGNTPPVSPPQGRNGGNAFNPAGAGATPPCRHGGGGGGATAVGGNASSSSGGNGGAGATTEISNSPLAYSGGGGGGGRSSGGSAGSSLGGGGTDPGGPVGGSGTANRGAGGGGSGEGAPGGAGAGGKGVVIIRYKFQS